MEVEPPLLAIRISSERSPSLALSSDERDRLSRELQDVAVVRWLPQTITNDPLSAGISDQTTIMIFLLGLSLGAVAKPFWDGFASEAGKDVWKGLKQVAARIWKAQSDKSYRLEAHFEIVLELRNEFVVIECRPGVADKGVDLRQLEDAFQAELVSLAGSWDRIHADIRRLELGKQFGMHNIRVTTVERQTGMHRIRRSSAGEWMISPDVGESDPGKKR